MMIVNEFNRQYEGAVAIWWYTRKLISLNSFLSTTLKRNVAIRFIKDSISSSSSSSSDDLVHVLFEIDADPRVLGNKKEDIRRPFAQIEGLSYFE
ncbi:unnamed protein product, partial [Rotaria sp. Silwood1]